MKFDKLGWVVAAGLLGAFVASGFQTSTIKMGTVDMIKVFNDSSYTKGQTEVLRTMGKARQDLMEFLSTYRATKTDDAQKLRDLSLKDNPTAADKAAADALKAAIIADDGKFRDLQTKQNPTADETKTLTDYNQRAQNLSALQQRWATEFDDEVQKKQAALRSQALDKVKAAVGDVAKKQGFSIVFDSGIAPFSSNDITDEALNATNKK